MPVIFLQADGISRSDLNYSRFVLFCLAKCIVVLLTGMTILAYWLLSFTAIMVKIAERNNEPAIKI